MKSDQTIIPTESDIGKRIDKFISENIDYSRTRIKSIIDEGLVFIDDKSVKGCSVKIKNLSEIKLQIPEIKDSDITANEYIKLDIAYEDDDLIVINKQAGLTVHPGAGNYHETMVNALMHYYGDNLSEIGGIARPGIVHRLDKDTSGLIIVAKNDKAHISLSEQIAERSVKRVYTAFCWGIPKPYKNTIRTKIDRNPKNRLKMSASDASGKIAITHYEVKEIYGNGIASKVECKLQTGRTHQIRVHMHHKGNPILGDQLYGFRNQQNNPNLSDSFKNTLKDFKRQALHSSKLTFEQPITKEIIDKSCPLPDDMQLIGNELKML